MARQQRRRCSTPFTRHVHDRCMTVRSKITCLRIGISQNSLHLVCAKGPIPTQIGNLFQLTVLTLSGNQLTGSCAKLTWLQDGKRVYHSLDSCAGAIPTDIGRLVSLQKLSLSWNKLTGKHPSAHIFQNGKRVYHHSKVLLLCAKVRFRPRSGTSAS